MTPERFACALVGFLVIALSACQTTLVNKSVATETDFVKADEGIPWVEPREYEVLVFEGVGNGNPKQIYYGRHELLDKVSGTTVDPSRRRWQTNYSAGLFADATVTLTFDEVGSLTKAETTTSAAAPRAAEAVATAVSVEEANQTKELEKLKRELDLLETKKKLKEAKHAE